MIHFTKYMRIAYRLTLSLLCCTFLYSCSDRAALESVEQVLATAEEHPDEALEQICSIDPNKLHGEHNRARYALAYSEALYYNRIDSDCDTLVEPMMRYYIHHDNNHSERARALYQYALVMDNAERYADALFSLLEADRSLNISENFKLHGLIYRTMGDIYSKEMLFSNALDAYSLSKEYFDKAGCETHSAYAMLDISKAHMSSHNYDDAYTASIAVIDYAKGCGDKYLLSFALCDAIEYCIKVPNDDNISIANGYMKLLDEIDITNELRNRYYSIKAILCAYNNDLTGAKQNLMSVNVLNKKDAAYLWYAKYLINRHFNNYSSALYSIEELSIYEDNNVLSALKVPIINEQLDYINQKYEFEKQKRIENRIRYITYIILMIIITTSLIIILILNNLKHKKSIEQYVDTIAGMQSKIQCGMMPATSSTENIFNSRFIELNKLCDTYYDHSNSPKQQAIVFRKLTDTIESIKSDKAYIRNLIASIDKHQNNILSRLREQCPNLSDREYRIVVYSYAGFSLRAIAIFLNSKPETISKSRYKIKAKIKESNAIDAGLFINNL